MKTFFQHRAEMIFTGIKECNDPYLIGGSVYPRVSGHLRYSHVTYDYAQAKRDFDTDWFGRQPFPPKTFYERRRAIAKPRRLTRFLPWSVELNLRDCFGETVYGKMLAKIRSKS